MDKQRDPNLNPLRPDDIRLLGGIILLALTAIGLWLAFAWFSGNSHVDYDMAERQSVSFRVDLNQAGWAEISQLPGIGETIARRIVAHRVRDGRFESLSELDSVHGIGPMKLSAIKPFLAPFPTDSETTMEGHTPEVSSRGVE